MTLSLKRMQSHLNVYHQTDSLLLQFILSEFINSYRQILIIHELSSATNLENPLLVSKAVSKCIEKLSGSSQTSLKMYSWNLEEGMLAKLKNYCERFSNDHQDYYDLHQFAHQAWLNCLQSFEILKSSGISSKNLQKVLHRIVSLMRRFARSAIRVMQRYRDDENIIFFILRHHTDLDSIYGPHFVVKLFSRLFPKGPQTVIDFLQKKYEDRGFDNLKKVIDKKMAELSAV